MANKTLSDVAKGDYNKELILENVVLGIGVNSDLTNSYYAFDKDRPELVVNVESYPGFNMDYNDAIISHYGRHGIEVTVEGGSRGGLFHIKKASKILDEKEVTLVSSSPEGYFRVE